MKLDNNPDLVHVENTNNSLYMIKVSVRAVTSRQLCVCGQRADSSVLNWQALSANQGHSNTSTAGVMKTVPSGTLGLPRT